MKIFLYVGPVILSGLSLLFNFGQFLNGLLLCNEKNEKNFMRVDASCSAVSGVGPTEAHFC
jgi:hypothetical protein